MDFNLAKDSMELLIDEIICAVENNTDDRALQINEVKEILQANGIIEIEED